MAQKDFGEVRLAEKSKPTAGTKMAATHTLVYSICPDGILGPHKVLPYSYAPIVVTVVITRPIP